MPFFSVLIPLYNKEKHIKATLNSVISQTFTDFEIIVINDGSTDSSALIVNDIKDSRIKLINQDNLGLSGARNTGIRNATAEYIALIDADDFWLPHHLKQLYNLINCYPNCGLYTTGYTLKKSESIFHRAYFNNLTDNFIGIVPNFFKNSLQNCIAWIGAVCIPKKVFNEIGTFDPEIFSEQDTDLYIRIALKYNIALDNTSVSAIYNRTMDDNMSTYSNKTYIPKFLNSYKGFENSNPALKKYMDYNRFSTLIYLKLSSNSDLAIEVLKDIDLDNLNNSQKLLIKLPKSILKLLINIKTIFKLSALSIFKPKNY